MAKLSTEDVKAFAQAARVDFEECLREYTRGPVHNKAQREALLHAAAVLNIAAGLMQGNPNQILQVASLPGGIPRG